VVPGVSVWEAPEKLRQVACQCSREVHALVFLSIWEKIYCSIARDAGACLYQVYAPQGSFLELRTLRVFCSNSGQKYRGEEAVQDLRRERRVAAGARFHRCVRTPPSSLLSGKMYSLVVFRQSAPPQHRQLDILDSS
jgi:hypothetical protein